ncbi:DNA polymerase III subunit delta' [Vibrio sp. 03-59-1]|uniref:DNA polymerase III subunit delta' n=1 Tax=Vibrio sp. 03-59-1 TaxID=2607607 RepID=UPI001493AA9B|nr:DNA polymerase III subunit delta' [Vibrio sp. 03-59-1]NOH83271.1 DNA polymerase III subunit delta' [Vibrio sp. 03-59-1]
MSTLYPWLQPTWEQLKDKLDNQRLSGSMLISACNGVGILQLLEHFSAALMCSNYTSEACGFCHSCELIKSGSHPDLHWIKPEKEGKSITVDQIRQCNHIAQQSSQLNGTRLIIVTPAEAMNESASNALLKTLEEPADNCVFLLVTENSHKLLPTIISRCQQMQIVLPSSAELTDWVGQQTSNEIPNYVASLNHHAPLKTLEFVNENGVESYRGVESAFITFIDGKSTDVYELWSALESDTLTKLSWIWYLLSDTQKAHFGINSRDLLPGSDALAKLLTYEASYQLSHLLKDLMDQLSNHTGLNTELMVINWLLKLQEASCS